MTKAMNKIAQGRCVKVYDNLERPVSMLQDIRDLLRIGHASDAPKIRARVKQFESWARDLYAVALDLEKENS